jgi:glycosyltransferase involved in cell wall biosynthesis
VPPQERTAFAAQLAQAALVVLLSDYETHPLAAIEALALGRSLLVADTSGLAELAQQGLACAIPLSSSPEQIAAAAVELLQHPLHPPTLHLPTWDECTAQLLDLYRDIVGNREVSNGRVSNGGVTGIEKTVQPR